MRQLQLSAHVPTLILALAAGALAQQDPLAPPTEPPPFVEIPGEQEFTGEMIARPLQPEDAQRYGLPRFEVQARARAAAGALRAYQLVEYVPETDETVFRVAPGSENAVARRLMAGGEFQYVEPNWRVYPVECPNDPLFGNQWHHAANRMNSCAGWGLEKGDLSVVIAICDTGVRINHEDLQLHRMEGYNAVDKLWESQGGAVNDINGHGTLTTGCAAAKGNNNKGVIGTGWSLSHRMMRVSNDSGGGSSINTLTHAARTAADVGDRVASVSYTGVKSSSVNSTGGYLNGKGAWLVWAAGNSDSKLGGKRDDNVIVVGATNSSDGKASFSSFGSFVDLFAPGTSIWSTSNSGNKSYGSASGTSFSTPLTAGLLGLIWSADPTLTPDDVEAILRCGCDDLGGPGEDNTFGFGRIDVGRTMRLAVEYVSLFSDDFESGDFTSGGWATKNAKPKVLAKASHAGMFGARIKRSTWIERAIDTKGFEDIVIKYNRRTKNFDSGENLKVMWWDGSTWDSVDTTTKLKWTGRFRELPAGADDNPSFKIRFETFGNENRERADVDDVEVLGVQI